MTLTLCWVNRLDTGEAVSANSQPARQREHAVAGDVRTYAGGRQRAYTLAGEQGKFEFTLVMLSLSTVDILRSWVGVPVQIRDTRGQRFFGVFFSVPVVEHRVPSYYDVTLSLQTITVVEGV